MPRRPRIKLAGMPQHIVQRGIDREACVYADDDLQKLTASLRQWYFEKGGLFLSEKSRDSYFALQDAIKKVLDVKGQSGGATVDEETYENLRKSGSELRTALTRDVGTRKSPKLN